MSMLEINQLSNIHLNQAIIIIPLTAWKAGILMQIYLIDRG